MVSLSLGGNRVLCRTRLPRLPRRLERFLEQRLGLIIAARLLIQTSEGAEYAADGGVFAAKRLLADSQRCLEQRLGLIMAVSSLINTSEGTEYDDNVGVFAAKRLFVNS